MVITVVTTFVFQNSAISVVLCVLPILFLFMQNSYKLKLNSFFVILLGWDMLNLVHLIYRFDSYHLRILIFQNIVLLFVYISSISSCSEGQFCSISKNANLFVIALCVLEIFFFVIGVSEFGFSFAIFGLMYFVLCEHGWGKIIKMLLIVFAFIFGRNRSSLLMIIFCVVVHFLQKKGNTSKTVYRINFFITAGITYLLPKGYTWLYQSEYRIYLNNLSRELFGKNFFSGRQVLWIQIFEWFEQHNMILGIGSEFIGGKYAEQLGISTHNVTLFLLGQGGWLILVLFLALLYKIYMRFYDHIEDPKMIWASSFLLGLMFRSSFDLFLIGNRFVDSMFSWLSLCVALSYCNYLKYYKPENKQIKH